MAILEGCSRLWTPCGIGLIAKIGTSCDILYDGFPPQVQSVHDHVNVAIQGFQAAESQHNEQVRRSMRISRSSRKVILKGNRLAVTSIHEVMLDN
jgi:hypothetical protein